MAGVAGSYLRDQAGVVAGRRYRRRLVLSGPVDDTIGRYVAQGATAAADATRASSMLVRDASTGVGSRIQTSLPTP